jgi:uncharacterized membrane protein
MNYKALLKAILLTLCVTLLIIVGYCYPIGLLIMFSTVILIGVFGVSYLYFKLDYEIEDKKINEKNKKSK